MDIMSRYIMKDSIISVCAICMWYIHPSSTCCPIDKLHLHMCAQSIYSVQGRVTESESAWSKPLCTFLLSVQRERLPTEVEVFVPQLKFWFFGMLPDNSEDSYKSDAGVVHCISYHPYPCSLVCVLSLHCHCQCHMRNVATCTNVGRVVGSDNWAVFSSAPVWYG